MSAPSFHTDEEVAGTESELDTEQKCELIGLSSNVLMLLAVQRQADTGCYKVVCLCVSSLKFSRALGLVSRRLKTCFGYVPCHHHQGKPQVADVLVYQRA